MRLKKSCSRDEFVRIEVADFQCAGRALAASALLPENGSRLGIVFVVGGSQFRIGSHRQHLELANAAAQAGHPALIFDHRGLGDSEGPPANYNEFHDDIRGAIDTLFKVSPGLENVVLFGLCDGATAALLYAPRDSRITGLILTNPWLEAARSQARSRLTEYYGRRILSASFWAGVSRGRLPAGRSLFAALRDLARSFGSNQHPRQDALPSSADVAHAAKIFPGSIHVVLSGRDITARVFAAELDQSAPWRSLKSRKGFTRCNVAAADHTFSRSAWHEALTAELVEFLKHCPRTGNDSN